MRQRIGLMLIAVVIGLSTIGVATAMARPSSKASFGLIMKPGFSQQR